MHSSSSPKDQAAPSSRLILVTGATGQQGGQVARHLLERGHRVRALVRDPQSPKVQDLRAKGVEAVAGSFDDPASIQRAARGINGMFLMGTPFQGGVDGETRQGIAAVDAAKAAAVPWLVYSSVASANQSTGIPHFESKFAVEEHLRRSGVPFAVSAPTSFMENFLSPLQLPALRQGKLPSPLPPDRAVQSVALDDLGVFVTQLLENPSRFRGKRIDVASDSVSQAAAARVLSELSGRKIEYQRIPLDAIRAQNADYAKMFEWFERGGYSVDIDRLRKEYPEVGWHRFRDWAADRDWTRLLG
jgi:uncharacterized protein YbjT (DUF2867 family)